uniref:Uncharacterized protein n=1 Tax=Globisporangium ultimum (strain ATCC 200006 / CBS 805.95 / DAOM BR144) TaxID=431595 RepID=K3X1U9_GLOUD
MPRPNKEKQEHPNVLALVKKPQDVKCAEMIAAVTSVTDLIIPGLGASICVVLAMIKELCKRLLKQKHGKIMKLGQRIGDLYELTKQKESQGKFPSPEWLSRYGDVVARFRLFMARCEQQHILLRLVKGSKESKETDAFEEEIYSLYQSMDFQYRGGHCCVQ